MNLSGEAITAENGCIVEVVALCHDWCTNFGIADRSVTFRLLVSKSVFRIIVNAN